MDLELVPLPAAAKVKEDFFRIEPPVEFHVEETVRLDEPSAELLVEQVSAQLGFDASLKPLENGSRSVPGAFTWHLDSGLADLAPEGYVLEVDGDGVEARAPTTRGLFYAGQTLRLLLRRDREQGGAWCLPHVKIRDFPRFPWRGFMLDAARHFQPKELIFRLLDAMALLKLNVFHWGLTNDQGWRIQLEAFPELVEVGSKRASTQVGGYLSRKKDGKLHSGYYSKEDVREVVQEARARGIKVVPEVNFPGHCVAALAAKPELSCTGGPFEVATTFGIKKDVLCLGGEEALPFVKAVWEEILELFPSDVVHVGGDEVPTKRWKECPKCRAKVEREGLGGPRALQHQFTNELARFLVERGRRAIGWNEVLDGDLHESVLVQFWLRGKKRLLEDVRCGRKVVMSPFGRVYLDYDYHVTPLRQTYGFEPVPKQLEPEHRGNVLGLEAPLWTEWVRSEERVFWQSFPRLVAVAETGWTLAEKKDYASFLRRLPHALEVLETLGVRSAPLRAADPPWWKRLVWPLHFGREPKEPEFG
ncbi:MAG: beta-N-acetylhexosaminidase [Promethearchaeota archaeon]